MIYLTPVAFLAAFAAFVVLAVRLREMSLLRTKGGFLLLHVAGATFCGWTALQAALYAAVDPTTLAGLMFVLCYLYVSRTPWTEGPPAYTYRDTLVDHVAESTLTS